MKTIMNFTVVFIAIIVLSVTISECKNSSATSKEDTSASIDTPAVVERPQADTLAAAPKVDTPLQRVPLTLIINNLRSTTAPVTIGVYGTDNKFPDPKDQLKEYKFTPNGKQLVAEIRDLNFGTYALAIYQDVNSNGKIDKTIIGIPTEPYAFSNNYRPKVKAPSFKDCKFEYNEKTNSVTMAMLK